MFRQALEHLLYKQIAHHYIRIFDRTTSTDFIDGATIHNTNTHEFIHKFSNTIDSTFIACEFCINFQSHQTNGWSNRVRTTIVASLLFLVSAANGQADDCGMALAFRQPDNDGKTSIAVWSDPGSNAMLFADTMNINTDGTRRSYSVDDFWGEKHALNNLCNAMSDVCNGLKPKQLQERRITTQQAKAAGWPATLTAATKISPSIIPFKSGKPCAEVDGYLVSATTLHKAHIADACDISNYADALSVPAIVLPKRAKKGVPTPFENLGAKVGDLVVTMSADGRLIKYAVAGDMGPAKSLGEISLALAADLLSKDAPPANYREVRGKGPYAGRGWNVGKTFTLIFPQTRDIADPYMTRERIERDAAAAFQRWGGEKRLRACSAIYKAQ